MITLHDIEKVIINNEDIFSFLCGKNINEIDEKVIIFLIIFKEWYKEDFKNCLEVENFKNTYFKIEKNFEASIFNRGFTFSVIYKYVEKNNIYQDKFLSLTEIIKKEGINKIYDIHLECCKAKKYFNESSIEEIRMFNKIYDFDRQNKN